MKTASINLQILLATFTLGIVIRVGLHPEELDDPAILWVVAFMFMICGLGMIANIIWMALYR